ncbi:MAG: PCMD domain-containing protein [Bacteroidales bacterium]|nr:PCMD domain-containing protein [Bacteroidales bacterium]
MKKTLGILLASFTLLTSCTIILDDGMSDPLRGVGMMELKVSVREATRSTDAEDLLGSSRIKIYNGDYSGMVRDYRFAEMPSAIYLPCGNYRVDVVAGEMAKDDPCYASWESRSYKGSERVSISAGNVSDVSILAGIYNVVTKVDFDPSVGTHFEDGYSFTIGLDQKDEDRRLSYTENENGRRAYFIPDEKNPSLYWEFNGTSRANGSTFRKSGRIDNVKGGTLYTMSPKFTVSEGGLTLVLIEDDGTDVSDDIIVFEPVSTGLVPSAAYEIWAAHMTVHAEVDESEYPDPSAIRFEYAGTDARWTSVPAERSADGGYYAVIRGLEAETEYSYRLVIADEVIGTPMTVVTDSAEQLPNNDLEYVSNTSGWDEFYDPNSSDPLIKYKFWDTGSSASASVLSSAAICYSDTDVPAGIGSTRSARLQSKYVVVKFAAGNLFTGEFAGLSGMNGKVNFGRPWTARPTAIRFWYKYKGGTVDYAPSGSPISKGDQDRFFVKVALGNWDYTKYGGSASCPLQVNTGDKSTFWDIENIAGTIAYADLWESAGTGNAQWKQVTLRLDYKSEVTMPTHIIVSCAASGYGDYFAGCSSSALYVDKFELIYD